jgi:hypothetical protein
VPCAKSSVHETLGDFFCIKGKRFESIASVCFNLLNIMVVCGDCVIIPVNNYKYALVFSYKRDTCCKCKEYKNYIVKLLIKN